MIQIIKSKTLPNRSYKRHSDVRRAITQLRKHGWNYFVVYKEANEKARAAGQTCAIQYGKVDWVKGRGYHIDW